MPNFAQYPDARFDAENDQNRSYSFPYRGIAGDSCFSSVTSFEGIECQSLHGGGQTARYAENKSSRHMEQLVSSIATLKWQHTVLDETDFTDEWTAQDRAFHLAAEFMYHVSDCTQQVDSEPTVKPKPSGHRQPVKHVTLKEEVDLHIGLDEDQSFCCITIPYQSLNMPNKPWSLVPLTGVLHEVAQDVDPFACRSYCEFQTAFPQVSLVDPPSSIAVTHPAVHNDLKVFASPTTSLENQSCGETGQYGVHVEDLQAPSTHAGIENQQVNRCIQEDLVCSANQARKHATQAVPFSFLQPNTPQPFSNNQHGVLQEGFTSLFAGACTEMMIPPHIDEIPGSPIVQGQSRFLVHPFLPSDPSTTLHKNLQDTTDQRKPNVRHEPQIAKTPVELSSRWSHDIHITPPRPVHLGKARDNVGSRKTGSGEVVSTPPIVARSFDVSDSFLRPTVQPWTSSEHPSIASQDDFFHQCRLEHESLIADLAPRTEDHHPPGGDDQQAQVPPLQTPPAFVADLSTRFVRMGYDINSGDFDVLLRTWYIDHATIRRWTAPRNLQLIGPPRGWEEQFSSIWVDQINPDEWFDVTIIHPDPPRTAANSFVVLDVVISQSLQLDRFAGLVTVVPAMQAWFGVFSVAASFDPQISGFDIAQAADAAELCRYQECSVTFGWQEIPYSLRPHHDMSHGDGFQVQIRSQPAQLATDTSTQAGSSTDRRHEAQTQHAVEDPPQGGTQGTFPSNPSFVTPLHVFQIDGQEVVVQLVNAQLAQPTHNLANALRVPFNCIEALHVMPVPPDGFPELAIPAIVQRVGDIGLHSTDRLIMIDVNYHHHPNSEGTLDSPTLVRGVYRVTHQVTRQQILFKAAVYHYCEFLQEGCAVSLDGFLWPLTHTDPRPVSHGSYATVDVPPPYGHQVDTQTAATTLHHDGTTDAMMDFLLDPMDESEDATFMTQLYASRMVIASVVKHRLRWCCRNSSLPADVHAAPSPAVSAYGHCGRISAKPERGSLDRGRHIEANNGIVAAPCSPNEEPIDTDAFEKPQCPGPPGRVCTSPASHAIPEEEIATVVKTHAQKPAQAKVQSSLGRFFSKVGSLHPAGKQKGAPRAQLKIHDFFIPKTNVQPSLDDSAAALTELGSRPRRVQPDVSVHARIATLPAEVAQAPKSSHRCQPEVQAQPLQLKCSEEQEAGPPVCPVNLPPAQAQQAHNPPPRPAWRIHLSNLFDELATVVHRETGPVMQVEVWYIHHDDFPECVAPRTVELDDAQELWYADFCNVWMDRIQRHQPMRVVNVLPNPPYHTHPRTAVHVILEQGLSPHRVALHFTAIFLGGDRVGLFQRVESSSSRICTRDMIVRHGFQLQCDIRPCNMHSGLLRFQMDVPEEFFSGICAVLSVAPPPPEPAGLQGPPPVSTQTHSPEVGLDEVNFMQSSTHARTSAYPQEEAMSAPAQPFDHRMTPAALSDFRATLLWQVRGPSDQCETHLTSPFSVHTWYLNSDTRIRTEDFRTVWLGPQPSTWHHDIIERWREMLDVAFPVHLFVVMPNPPGHSLEQEAHVIIVQRPNPLWRAALLTVSHPRVDPWHIQFLCVMLDAETSLEQFAFISGVTHPSNPDAPRMRIQATHGQATIQNEATFPVRHGFWFDIHAYRLDDPWDDEIATIQIGFQTIKRQIADLQNHITEMHRTVMPSETGEHPPWIRTHPITVAAFPNAPGDYIPPLDPINGY